ncbi:MAG: hypothetical protein DMG09_23065, partial [Acidobacteria bacterium]
SIIRDNYGQVYSLFIERLIGLSETRRGQLREQFEQRRRCYEEEAKGILGRQASVFAAAETAGRLIEEILELRDLNPDGVVNRIFARVCDEAESDGPRNALVEILGWADANDDYFSHRLLDGSLAPARPGEKLGHKDPNSVAIYPAKLKEMLRRFGYDIKTTLTAWRDRNWIKLTENDKFTYVVRAPNGRTRMIKIVNLDPMNDGTLKDEELW